MLFPNPKKYIYIYIYYNIYKYSYNFQLSYNHISNCNTATLQQREQSDACIDSAERLQPRQSQQLQHMTAENVAKIWLFEILLLILPRNYEEKKEL